MSLEQITEDYHAGRKLGRCSKAAEDAEAERVRRLRLFAAASFFDYVHALTTAPAALSVPEILHCLHIISFHGLVASVTPPSSYGLMVSYKGLTPLELVFRFASGDCIGWENYPIGPKLSPKELRRRARQFRYTLQIFDNR